MSDERSATFPGLFDDTEYRDRKWHCDGAERDGRAADNICSLDSPRAGGNCGREGLGISVFGGMLSLVRKSETTIGSGQHADE